ncbi:DNA processing protein DprA [Fulvitalea axinellae]|uniref:DNA processing protein DprA n=1 Tax=Fulvitalea axinellae TaxID=1182444 RepID=A0AAU9C954_9BACT|nr:DNA processing protein DprA [Fulvitalea axinellae]
MLSKEFLVALNLVAGIGGATVRRLISYFGSLEHIKELPPEKLTQLSGIGPKIATLVKNALNCTDEARRELERCDKMGVQVITYSDPDFPTRISQIQDCPLVLYYKGTADLNAEKILGIVGTRKATSYGRNVAREFVEDLRGHSPLIVSGLAYGIDITAHQAALDSGLDTIGVMGNGINVMYPKNHLPVAKRMVEQGGILTENPLDTQPDPRRFPARNRLIAGLSDAVIVTEAGEKGGALITANLANDYDREVFAVPGKIDMPYSIGCHKLIRTQRAHLMTSVADLEYIMNWNAPDKQIKIKFEQRPDLSDTEKGLLQTLQRKGGQTHLDNLSWASGVPVHIVSSVLLQLELKGLVKMLPGHAVSLKSCF